jgi:general secretion pathway protein A
VHPDPREARSSGLYKLPSASISLTYETFYGLHEKPFSLSSDSRFLFKSPSHAPAFERLLAGIRRREGLIVLTGEPGTGKTTTCRAVLEHLDRRTFSAFVPDPFVSREDLLKMLLIDFGVLSVEDLKAGRLKGASRPDLSYPLYEFLTSLAPLQAFAVLIIDEAQNLPVPLLEEVRILADLEAREKLLQVVLIGQPELRTKLKLPEMRQVDQRVSVHCELAPLGRAEVAAYVAHRLNIAAGGPCERLQFTPSALDAVHAASNGVPRLVNRICDAALHHGWLQRIPTIDGATVMLALEELGMQEPVVDEIATVPDPGPPDTRDHVGIGESEAAEMFVAEAVQKPRPRRRRINMPAIAAAVLLLLVISTFGVASWYTRFDDSATETILLPPLPAAPRMRVPESTSLDLRLDRRNTTIAEAPRSDAGHYVINVAVFRTSVRAATVMTELTDAGYTAYYTELNLQGVSFWQVIVGAYETVADAQADLDKIRAIPGFRDARIGPAR